MPLLGAALPLAPYAFTAAPAPLDAVRVTAVLGLALAAMLLVQQGAGTAKVVDAVAARALGAAFSASLIGGIMASK